MCAVLRKCTKLWDLDCAFSSFCFFVRLDVVFLLGKIFARVCGGINRGAFIDNIFLFSWDCDGREGGRREGRDEV